MTYDQFSVNILTFLCYRIHIYIVVFPLWRHYLRFIYFNVQFYVFFSFKNLWVNISMCLIFVRTCMLVFVWWWNTMYQVLYLFGRWVYLPLLWCTWNVLSADMHHCNTIVHPNFTLETRFLFSPIKFKPCSNLLSPSLLSLALQPSLPFRLRQGAVRLFRIRMIIMIK